MDIAKQPVPFVALYDLIQGGNAGTLRLAYDGDARIAYRVELADQGTIWAGFDDGAIQYGCLQTPDLDEPVCNDGTDREQEYRDLIQQFVNGLLSAEAVETNFGAIAARGPAGAPRRDDGPARRLHPVRRRGHAAAVRARGLDHHRGVGGRGGQGDRRAARDASTEPSEDDFAPPALDP